MAETLTPPTKERGALLCIDTMENLVPAPPASLATKLSQPRSPVKGDWEERAAAAEERRLELLAAKAAKAHVEKRAPAESPFRVGDVETKLAAATERRSEHLGAVKLKAKVKDVARPASPGAEARKADLEARLAEAEARRGVELDARKFKAASFAQKREPPEANGAEKAEALAQRLTLAAERRELALSAKKTKAHVERREPLKVDIEAEKAELEEKLREAEIRRDIELEAIRFKAQQSSARKARTTPPPSPRSKAAMDARLAEADARRATILDAKKAKAAVKEPRPPSPRSTKADVDAKLLLAEARRAEYLDSVVHKAQKKQQQQQQHPAPSSAPHTTQAPSSPTSKKSLDEKLSSASARKTEATARKLETAAALGSDRVEAARERRAAEDAAAHDLKRHQLEAKAAEAVKRHEAALAEHTRFAERDAQRVAQLHGEKDSAAGSDGDDDAEAIAKKREALLAKQEHAEQLKADKDRAVVQRAHEESAKLAKARAAREAQAQAEAAELAEKEAEALKRADEALLDRVAKAAHLGSEAVLTAGQRRAQEEKRRAQHLAADQMKLDVALELHDAVLTAKQEKAAVHNAKVAETASAHKQRAAADADQTAKLDGKLSQAAQRALDQKSAKVDTAHKMGSVRVAEARARRGEPLKADGRRLLAMGTIAAAVVAVTVVALL